MGLLPLVKVHWLDAWVDTDAEQNISDIQEKLKLCVDVGVLLKKTKKTVVLACNYEEGDQVVRFVTQIPMVLVLKIVEYTQPNMLYEKRGAKDAQTTQEAQEKAS